MNQKNLCCFLFFLISLCLNSQSQSLRKIGNEYYTKDIAIIYNDFIKKYCIYEGQLTEKTKLPYIEISGKIFCIINKYELICHDGSKFEYGVIDNHDPFFHLTTLNDISQLVPDTYFTVWAEPDGCYSYIALRGNTKRVLSYSQTKKRHIDPSKEQMFDFLSSGNPISDFSDYKPKPSQQNSESEIQKPSPVTRPPESDLWKSGRHNR